MSKDKVYKKRDGSKITIEPQDIMSIQPKQWINDTILEFYFAYKTDLLDDTERDQYHIFNSFLYETWKSVPKEKQYAAIQRWTRHVDVFAKKYILIPLHLPRHWTLAIICNPLGLLQPNSLSLQTQTEVNSLAKWVDSLGDLLGLKRKEYTREEKVEPCILYLDSTHKELPQEIETFLKEYLRSEYETRHPCAPSIDFQALSVHNPIVPKQENGNDCGVYVMKFVEVFLQEQQVRENSFQQHDVDALRTTIQQWIGKLPYVEDILPKPTPKDTLSKP